MWNSKRSHGLLMFEIFISFLVLFAVCSTVLHQYKQYKRPLGFDYENVWTINFNELNAPDSSLLNVKDQLLGRIRNFPEVISAGSSGGSIMFTGGNYRNEVQYKDNRIGSDRIYLGTQDGTSMNIPILEGRWFNKADEVGKPTSVVINIALKETLFGAENPIGKVIAYDPNNPTTFRKVVGVISDLKYISDFQQAGHQFIEHQPVNNLHYDILLKVKPDVSAEFEATLSKTIAQMTKGWQVEIEKMSEKKAFVNKFTYIPTLILMVVCSFLIFNVLLGLFGILWYNINKRKGEIGLRRAMGATQRKIALQFIGEIVVIATFALIIGLFFAIQFPLLGVLDIFRISPMTYYQGIVFAILLIYGIIVFCAFYPSWQASRIHPAVALHAD